MSETLNILSTINGIHCPVVTFCYSQAIGPAVVIAAHGLKGFRVAAPNSRFSFKGIIPVTKRQDSVELDSALDMMAEVLAEDVRKPKQQVLRWFREGAQFTAQEALTNSLVDAISTQPLLPKASELS